MEKELTPLHLNIKPAYGDPNGSHVSIEVVSEAFKGKRELGRQQLILRIMKPELASGAIHAVDSIVAKTPEEAGMTVAQDTSAAESYISTEAKGSALWVTMNRPKVMNAFDEHLIAELTQVFNSIDCDKYRSVVLTGTGKAFSAGADLNWMKKMVDYTQAQNKADSEGLYDMVNAIKTCPLPVIGRINGAALGGGSGLVAACDIALALDKAKFGFTEVKLGLIPAVISPFVMQKIGTTHASRYFLTAEVFPAAEARRIGLVQDTAATEAELDAMVEQLTAVIDKNSPAAVKRCKRLIAEVDELGATDAARDHVSTAIADIRVSPEGQDGLSAFLNKRKPSWV